MPLNKYSEKKVMVIGSGPIVNQVRRQSLTMQETQACRALKEEGLEVV